MVVKLPVNGCVQLSNLVRLCTANCAGDGTEALAVTQEDGPIVAVGQASTHKIPKVVNGTTLYVLATTER